MNIFRRIYIHIPEIGKLIRSFYFCFRYLPFNQAIKMPIFLAVPVKVCQLHRGGIMFNGPIQSRQIEFVEGIEGFPADKTNVYIEKGSKIIFYGKAFISRGSTLRIDEGGILKIGKDFVINKNTIIRCSDRITFHDDVMIGWNNEINDNDGHPIYIEGERIKSTSPIKIGPHVWITTYVKISKGVEISEGCIVAKGAVVTKKHNTPNSLIGGIPAKDIRTGVDWSRH
jgi:acetyltransferase-like isoleucine patch superfamily enzyme